MKRGLAPTAAGLRALAALAAGAAAFAAEPESAGRAEVAIQGYYQGSNSQPVAGTSGLAFRFQHLIPNFGLISGSLENYGRQGRFRTGENYFAVQGARWGGLRWTVTGGDFRTNATLVDFPFYNLYYPQIATRGVQLEASQGSRRYTFFAGAETLPEGPRVPYRVRVPQNLLGAALQQKFGRRLQLGVRFLRFSSDERAVRDNRFLFPLSRQFLSTDQLSVQSLYSPASRLRIYSETSWSRAERPSGSQRASEAPLSALVGSAWDSPRFTARMNYTYQGASYLPLLGYFLGDRQGPYGEIRVRPLRRLDLYGSASRYENNLEKNPDVPKFQSTGNSAGASLTLPWRFNANGQLSTIRFSSRSTDQVQDSLNRMLIANLSRPIGRHTVRLSVREIRIRSNLRQERQRSGEIEDVFHWKRLVLGGAARLQRAVSEQRQNTVFVRGQAQLTVWRIGGYGNFETASDLVNRTLFATNAISTTVVGVNARLGSGWSLQIEGFRNRLTTELNPESIFVFGTRGIGVPTILSRMNQWSLYFRLTKELHWGGALPAVPGIDQYVQQHVPLVGAVEGFVFERNMSGNRPAEGVAVELDAVRTAVTDASGRYRFAEVPEGGHKVALAMRELPADYNPGLTTEVTLLVKPRQISRADFDVVRLSQLTGKIAASGAVKPENVLVRLLPGSRYTTTDAEGNFAFQNLPEGDYEVVIERKTLPADSELSGSDRVPAAVRNDGPPAVAQFQLRTVEKPAKPIRRIFEQPVPPMP